MTTRAIPEYESETGGGRLRRHVQCSCGDHGFIRQGKWVPA